MPRTRPPYSREFREQMVELVRAGRTPEELAEEFEPSAHSIRKWVKQDDLDAGVRADGLTSEEREELRRLRREVKQLKVEREILKKRRGLVRSGERLDPGTGFEFVKRHQADFPVTAMCRVLGLSPSEYYAWLHRPPSARSLVNAQLTEEIRRIHAWSRRSHGRPRMHAELRDEGHQVNHKRVGRLMKLAGIVGVTRRRKWRTTTRDPHARAAPDLVERNFKAERPNELWVSDITYVPTASGFLYLAVVLDAWSRRVVGWSRQTHLKTELVLRALDMAVTQRRPADVILHSDQGTQYSSIAFGLRCKHAGAPPSMGSVGDAYDNALCESFFASLECELIEQERFRNQAEARMAVFDYIEGWYNPHRRHSALGQTSPLKFEKAHPHAA